MAHVSIREKLHISTIDARARELALQYGVGIEVAEFCWAQYLDEGYEEHLRAAKDAVRGMGSLWFHAPFAELSPCAIDPKVLKLTRERYLSSVRTARALGINRLVIHSGYIPNVYFPEYFTERSIEFWRGFMSELPEDFLIVLENVMDTEPDGLIEIADSVGDRRLGICLDAGHANCVSPAAPAEWARRMGGRIRHVHIHNNHGERDTHNSLFDGTIPMEEFLGIITENCPEATFTIENMDAEPSLVWLAEKGYLL